MENLWKKFKFLKRSEDGKIDYSEFVSWAGSLVKGMEEEDKMKEEDLKQLFDLLDRDCYDFNGFNTCRKGNKVFSKEEMFHTLRVLGDIPANYVAEKGMMPDEIEKWTLLMMEK